MRTRTLPETCATCKREYDDSFASVCSSWFHCCRDCNWRNGVVIVPCEEHDDADHEMNEVRYAEALKEVERIWPLMTAASVGTPEGTKYEALLKRVDAYERKHFPIPVPAPEGAR